MRTQNLASAQPLGVVWHWTGGLCRGAHVGQILSDEIRGFDRAKDRAASWNALVTKEGAIFQSVSFNTGSWHVGRPGRIGAAPVMTGSPPSWNATAWTGGSLFANINSATLGIELANAGRLEKVGEKFYCSPWWLEGTQSPDSKLEIEPERAVAVGDKWYDAFPDAQVQAAQRLLLALVQRYKLTRDVSRYGHVMFDPGRKEDPGPLWLDNKLPTILDSIFGAP